MEAAPTPSASIRPFFLPIIPHKVRSQSVTLRGAPRVPRGGPTRAHRVPVDPDGTGARPAVHGDDRMGRQVAGRRDFAFDAAVEIDRSKVFGRARRRGGRRAKGSDIEMVNRPEIRAQTATVNRPVSEAMRRRAEDALLTPSPRRPCAEPKQRVRRIGMKLHVMRHGEALDDIEDCCGGIADFPGSGKRAVDCYKMTRQSGLSSLGAVG